MSRKLTGDPPKIKLPKGSVDCHMHLYDKAFPGQEGGPPPPEDYPGIDMYRQMQEWLGLERVVVVQANAHQTDNRCVLNALSVFGDNARGIIAVTPSTEESTLLTAHEMGVRGARIMELPGGAVGLQDLLEVHAKITPLGWHNIVQFDGREMVEKKPLLEKLNGKYVIDHTGKFLSPVAPNDDSFKALLSLIDRGNCYVKLAGCYETSEAGSPYYEDLAAMSKTLINHAPERVIWGSNWPHVMLPAEEAPDDALLLDTVCSWIPSDEVLNKIFVSTPKELYGFVH